MGSEYFTAYLQGIVIAIAGCVHAAALAAVDMPWWLGLVPVLWIALGADWSMGGLREVAE